jgi:hypothetical protein
MGSPGRRAIFNDFGALPTRLKDGALSAAAGPAVVRA